MIIIVNGKIGSGKTYGAVAAALYKASQGRKVALNWDVLGQTAAEARLITRFYALKELEELKIEHTDVYVDEAHKELGARDWENLTPKLRNGFSESRKDDNHLIFVSQDYKFLDVYVRRLGEEVWTVYKFLCWTVWVKAQTANPESGELKGWDDLRIFRRPWKELEHGYPFGGLWDLWHFSKGVAGRFKTHAKTEKNRPAAPAAAAGTQSLPF